jgi:hypothetical protein
MSKDDQSVYCEICIVLQDETFTSFPLKCLLLMVYFSKMLSRPNFFVFFDNAWKSEF